MTFTIDLIDAQGVPGTQITALVNDEDNSGVTIDNTPPTVGVSSNAAQKGGATGELNGTASDSGSGIAFVNHISAYIHAFLTTRSFIISWSLA